MKRPLEDAEVLDILSREIKQRKDSLQEFEKAGRDDLAKDVAAEIEIISVYLPQQLTEEEIKVDCSADHPGNRCFFESRDGESHERTFA